MAALEHIKKKIDQGEHGVLAIGGERAFIDEALKTIRDGVLSEGCIELNHHRFQAGQDELADLLSTAKTVPFLAQKRLIEIHDAEKLDAKEFIKYIENPSPSSVVVLLFNKIDRRNKLITLLTDKGLLHVFDIDDEQDRIKFISDEAESCGIKIGSEAAQFLSIVLGGELLSIKAAVKKLALTCEHGEVTIDKIEENIVASGEQDVFGLARAISEGRLSSSLYTLGLLRNSQENAIKFLGVLIWQFRVLVHIRHCIDQGMGDWDIRKQVSVFGDRYAWMCQVAKKRNIHFHINRLTRLVECDRSLKTQRMSEPLTIIEKVVYQSAVGL